MIELEQTQPKYVRDSLYESAIDSTWNEIRVIRNDFNELSWFSEHRYDDQIFELRARLQETMAQPDDNDSEDESLRNFYYMQFLRGSLDAIVYLPQLKSTEPQPFLRDMLALGLQYSATQALKGIFRDPNRYASPSHLKHSTGLINELVPIRLMNTASIVRATNKVMLPASSKLDNHHATDLIHMPLTNSTRNIPIQVKTRRGENDRIPKNGILITADDFDNAKHRMSQVIMADEAHSTIGVQKTISRVAFALNERIEFLASPEVQAKARSDRNRAMRHIVPPQMRESVGATNPQLAELHQRLLDDQTEIAV